MIGIVYALFSLVLIPFIALIMVAAAFVPAQQQANSFSPIAGITGGVVAIVMAPLIYGVLGFLFGMLAACIYNVVAKWTGGIEFEVE